MFFFKKRVLFCCFKTKKHVFKKKTFVLKQSYISSRANYRPVTTNQLTCSVHHIKNFTLHQLRAPKNCRPGAAAALPLNVTLSTLFIQKLVSSSEGLSLSQTAEQLRLCMSREIPIV